MTDEHSKQLEYIMASLRGRRGDIDALRKMINQWYHDACPEDHEWADIAQRNAAYDALKFCVSKMNLAASQVEQTRDMLDDLAGIVGHAK